MVSAFNILKLLNLNVNNNKNYKGTSQSATTAIKYNQQQTQNGYQQPKQVLPGKQLAPKFTQLTTCSGFFSVVFLNCTCYL